MSQPSVGPGQIVALFCTQAANMPVISIGKRRRDPSTITKEHDRRRQPMNTKESNSSAGSHQATSTITAMTANNNVYRIATWTCYEKEASGQALRSQGRDHTSGRAAQGHRPNVVGADARLQDGLPAGLFADLRLGGQAFEHDEVADGEADGHDAREVEPRVVGEAEVGGGQRPHVRGQE